MSIQPVFSIAGIYDGWCDPWLIRLFTTTAPFYSEGEMTIVYTSKKRKKCIISIVSLLAFVNFTPVH